MSIPLGLKNTGSNCYLNSGIQAISSCPRFSDEIKRLCNQSTWSQFKSDRLRKLTLFNNLMKMMKKKNATTDISTTKIFKEWTKLGQQDSFELLAHVINQVYDQIRLFLEEKTIITKGDVREWLRFKLPLRMNMEYQIKCQCGQTETSPLQSEIALHLSFKDRANNLSTSEYLYLEDMLENHFQEDEIQDYSCGRTGCTNRLGERTLKLFSPLPDTICIHLQRLYWNGYQMKKVDDPVSFSNRITIKGGCCKSEKADEEIGDCHYYLRSVIVHYGGESCGHYICYKKRNNSWYYTSDSAVRMECTEKVFGCNPYILFYERSDIEEVSPQIIKMNDHRNNNLNVIVHAIAACASFDALISNHRDSVSSVGALKYLVDLANGNIRRNEDREGAEIREWCDSMGSGGTLMSVLSTIYTELGGSRGVPMETDDGGTTNSVIFPLAVKVRREKLCSCELPGLPSSNEVIIDVPFIHEYRNHRGPRSMQDVLDECFNGVRMEVSACGSSRCSSSGSVEKMTLEGPLPDILCLRLSMRDGRGRSIDHYDYGVKIDDTITIRRAFVGVVYGETASSDCEYYLKSVICDRRCLRNVGGSWYRISSYEAKVDGVREIWMKTPCIMFYEATPTTPIVDRPDSPDNADTDLSEPEDRDPSTSATTAEDAPTVVIKGGNMNILVHALSSCRHLIHAVAAIDDDSSVALKHLRHLIALANGEVGGDEAMDEYVRGRWPSAGVDPLSLLNMVFKGFSGDTGNMEDYHTMSGVHQLPQMNSLLNINMEYGSTCVRGHKASFPNPPDIALHLLLTGAGTNTKKRIYLQDILDDHFQEKELKGDQCARSDCHKNSKSMQLKIIRPLTNTFCIHLQLLDNSRTDTVVFGDRITIRGGHCKREDNGGDSHYCLMSVIVQPRGSGGPYTCYKRRDKAWYYISNAEARRANAEEVFGGNPYMLFYEMSEIEGVSPQIIKTHSLNKVIHSIASCPRFLLWLNQKGAGDEIKSARDLKALIDLANGTIGMDGRLEMVIDGWISKGGFTTTMMTILGTVSNDIGKHKNHAPITTNYRGATYTVPSPMAVIGHRTLRCDYGHIEVLKPSNEIIHEVSFKVNQEPRGRIFTMQEVLDEHFKETIWKKPCISARCWRAKEHSESVTLGLPLPDILCIQLSLTDGGGDRIEVSDRKVKVDDTIIIKKQYIRESSAHSDWTDKEYCLKAFIDNRYCHRNIGGCWYRIGDNSVEVDDNEQIMEGSLCILMYEACATTPAERGAKKGSSMDGPITLRMPMSPSNMNLGLMGPTRVNANKYVDALIQAISSCRLFVEGFHSRLSHSTPPLRHLCYLIDIANGRGERVPGMDEYVERHWCMGAYDEYRLMQVIFNKIHEEVESSEGGRNAHFGIAAISFDNDSPTSLSSSIFANVHCSEPSSSAKTLQHLLDQHLEIHFDRRPKNSVLLLKSGDSYCKLCWTQTLCLRLSPSLSRGMDVPEEVIIGNNDCPRLNRPRGDHPPNVECAECVIHGCCYRKYYLRSLIDENDHCYRTFKDRWWHLDGSSSTEIQSSIIKQVQPRILFYECNVGV